VNTRRAQRRWKRILQPGRNCWTVEPVERAGLLIDGRDYYRAFYRAAKNARAYICIAGWQFDSEVPLLAGNDRKQSHGEVRFLPFLQALCEGNPNLRVYILAWDFSFIFTLKREFLQDWLFNWTTCERIQFRFDDSVPIGASHHQKFAVIDGRIAFVGGMDICACRWDDRKHQPDSPFRVDSEGRPYNLHHDIQAYLAGPAATRLARLFQTRWRSSGGGELSFPPSASQGAKIRPSVVISSHSVALSQTQPKTLVPLQDSIEEIRSLHLDAIRAAEQLIYIENQYFSSLAIYNALMERMQATRRSKLQIIMILPKERGGLLEELSMGIAQGNLLNSLKEIARQTGHHLGIYYTVRPTANGKEIPVNIHGKLLLVDDRFLTVGSANTNNRSMGLDTELNVAWEATSPRQRSLIRSIRRARTSLLIEHSGAKGYLDRFRSRGARRLVRHLDRVASNSRYNLRTHDLATFFDQTDWLKRLKPGHLLIDPEKPVLGEDAWELISREPNSLFAMGITWLNKMLLHH
jgi:phosphatidylserine/phosphatidylglycerophosphate/cardiolipin synthase-like enzyme